MRRITDAPKGLKRKTRHGPLGNLASTASPQTNCDRRSRPACGMPGLQIAPRYRHQDRVQFDSDDLAKRVFCRKQHGAAHAGAYIDECKAFDRVQMGLVRRQRFKSA